MNQQFDTIQYTISEKVARLYLNRPEHHNALNRKMVEELKLFFSMVSDNEDVLIVTVQGNGKSFCAGADLNWMQSSIRLSAEENLHETRMLFEMFEAIRNSKVVVIALAHGNIFGGGNGLFAACDLAYCTADSIFSLSETRIGLVAATIAPYLLMRIRPSKVKELIFTANRFNGETAENLGLADVIFDTFEKMEEYIHQQVSAILKGGPVSVIESKKLINQLSMEAFNPDSVSSLSAILARTRVSDEAQRGMLSFIERRR